MRPYLVLTAVVLIAASALGQGPTFRPSYNSCVYGCGPFVPMLTTPEISFQQVSPNPVGASNATTGLIAGATNSTLSQIEGSTSSTYTAAVWYQGGAPLITPEVKLWPEPLGRERHAMHDGTREEHGREEHGREEARAGWTYYTGREHTVSPASEAHGKKSDHVYTNDDITRQNDANGTVKHGGKTEKM
jgi:hypothetical protein